MSNRALDSERSRSRREWIAITISIVAALVALAAFRDAAIASERTRNVEANNLIDKAWDLLGGKPGTTAVFDLPHEAGTLEQANRMIRDAILKDPNNPRAFRCQATYYRAVLRFDKAAQAAQRAIKLASEPEELALDYVTYGAVLGSSSQLKAAEDAFSKAKSLDPNNPIVLYDLAVVYHAQKRDPESDVAYAEAVRLTAQGRRFPVPASQISPPSKRLDIKYYTKASTEATPKGYS